MREVFEGSLAGRVLEAAGPEIERSQALALGLFSPAGETRFANEGMATLLATPSGPGSVRASLVHPGFDDLVQTRTRERSAPIFRGRMQWSDHSTVARSVRGVVKHLGADVLIVAEPDVIELLRLGDEVSEAAVEIAGLHRRAELDKRALERTLGELRATQALLIHAEKMTALGQLMAGVAHEICNPLAFVGSNAGTLGDALHDVLQAYRALDAAVQAGGPELGRTAEALRRRVDLHRLDTDLPELRRGTLAGVARMQRIVDSLKQFARLDQAEVQSADVRECVGDALLMATSTLKSSGVAVALDLGEVPAVHCNPAELSQVFLNLVVNAAQAISARGGAGGHLRVRTRGEASRVVVELEDDGGGMTADVLGRIFEPFFTTKPVGQGTGIGLTIAHKIVVERHGGTLSATSTPGVGSTFTVTLPVEARP
jgi:signal transduction histidine kinase